ncbi:MAG: hypothetical protein GF329_16155 [Candidatus Lokiarchaeota archaeon]|nr:hypothetical protein [Candidatus Lokiarchaeota archaeon]
MSIIETFILTLQIIVTVATLIIVSYLILELVLFLSKIAGNKKRIFWAILGTIIMVSLCTWIYNTFGIYLFTNISLFDNIIFDVMRLIVSISTILLSVSLMIQIIIFTTDVGSYNMKKSMIISGAALLIIVAVVFYFYSITGILLFVNLEPFII